jgi:hypothetical protein
VESETGSSREAYAPFGRWRPGPPAGWDRLPWALRWMPVLAMLEQLLQGGGLGLERPAATSMRARAFDDAGLQLFPPSS